MIKPETVLKKVNEAGIANCQRTCKYKAEACIRARKAVTKWLAAAKQEGEAYLRMKSGKYLGQLKEVLAELEKQGVKIKAEDPNSSYWSYTGYTGVMASIGAVIVQFYYNGRGPAVDVHRTKAMWSATKVLQISFSTKRMLVYNRSLDAIVEPEEK